MCVYVPTTLALVRVERVCFVCFVCMYACVYAQHSGIVVSG